MRRRLFPRSVLPATYPPEVRRAYADGGHLAQFHYYTGKFKHGVAQTQSMLYIHSDWFLRGYNRRMATILQKEVRHNAQHERACETLRYRQRATKSRPKREKPARLGCGEPTLFRVRYLGVDRHGAADGQAA